MSALDLLMILGFQFVGACVGGAAGFGLVAALVWWIDRYVGLR